MILVLEYPRCSTCKKALQWLRDNGVAFEDRHIVEQNPTQQELTEWYHKSGLPLKRFFNTSGNLYKEQGLKDKLPNMSEEEQLALLAPTACWSNARWWSATILSSSALKRQNGNG